MHTHVAATEQLPPSLVRVHLSGGDLDRFVMPADTDAYVNVAIPPATAPYGGVFDPAEVKEAQPRELWPFRRRYTVRAWEPSGGSGPRLTLDFVVHGDRGVAGPWAANAAPGDLLVFEGPGSGYRPDPEADWHLMVGDESALPAIAASLEAVPEGTLAVVRLLCDGPDHEIGLDSPGTVDLQWLHRTGGEGDADLLPAGGA